MEDVEIAEASKALFEAPFAVLAHDRGSENGAVKFTYANRVRIQN